MYCERCRLLSDDKICPACGHAIRQVNEKDDCFLVEKDVMFGEMLADVLKQNGIPFYHSDALGAGMTAQVGIMLERYRFFVPYAVYEQARDIVEELFCAPDAQEETE